MKALVLGCGSIGLRHVGHLLQLEVSDIEAADPNPDACERARQKFGIRVSLDPEEALARGPEVVLVCTPAYLHVPMALKSLQRGAHVFIEKPLSTNLEGVDSLAQIAKAAGRTVQVGYNLRFHPAMKAMKQMTESGVVGRVLAAHVEFGLYLARWWANRDYRESYMADAKRSGGLLLDASHEIDMLLWLLGRVEEVAALGDRLSTLEISGEDVIEVILRMGSGAIASFHIDCLQPTYTRVHTLIGEGTCLRWDCPDGRADTSLGRLRCFDGRTERFRRIRLRGHPEDTYLEELRHFLRCVNSGEPPLVGMTEAIEVLKVCDRIWEAMRTRQVVKV